MSASELRAELREMRKSHPDFAPVSKMNKRDVAALIQRLKVHTEETPAAGQMCDVSKKVKPAVEHIKRAKEVEFPVGPAESSTKKGEPRKTARKAYEKPTKEEVEEDEKVVAKAKKSVKKPEPKKDAKKTDKPVAKSGKPSKGSPEMAERMRKLREMRGKKRE